jgi:hypothetical protein
VSVIVGGGGLWRWGGGEGGGGGGAGLPLPNFSASMRITVTESMRITEGMGGLPLPSFFESMRITDLHCRACRCRTRRGWGACRCPGSGSLLIAHGEDRKGGGDHGGDAGFQSLDAGEPQRMHDGTRQKDETKSHTKKVLVLVFLVIIIYRRFFL